MRKEIQINNVEALWPRLDKPYRFNRKENINEPCEPTADGAKYEMSFNMNRDMANWLHGEMKTAYEAEAKPDWPAFPSPTDDRHPFKKNDFGEYRMSCNKKAAYDGEATTPPSQWDAEAKRLPKDFQLTTGSKVNINVKLIPYNGTMGAGVSLRLMAVQVLEMAERHEVSPFGKTQGSFIDDQPFAKAQPTVQPGTSENPAKVAHPFGEQFEAKEEPKPVLTSGTFDDEIPF